MAGKKNNGVVAVISDLTNEQAAQLTKEIIKAKRKVAPKGRGMISSGMKENIGLIINKGRERLLEQSATVKKRRK
ncbi:hypothetical protein [Anaerobutyricum hallii]|uniref:Uncharacterized protein n=1 Tax=Anaerobutyricum hallii TaxID=39488 RepID=A0A415TX11_9FIRM|nr:hypothetical protein [Anaerobutyricum hallii]RHN10180.1 hypothetical protein DWZ29_13395 [Anaerobutyricum hallii]